ncbi:DUF308 domain-containing protein [Aminobacter carboxidus]|uniref:DUF308 domain-containing protein n=1 Tax=Aminobacter carboxidus TaxID=376165 RepID=A0A8E2BDG6_9HYPH|nr:MULTISPECIES: DUF308 domain-containing protein [Aminobacter carboxidus group]MBB6465790.1 uncharacterized membrane protein HdeD (DUF308 family) [Aminobacter lissarensis]MBE1204472.1 DUF308 domain-containing protein [Aminobacter carboxidus]
MAEGKTKRFDATLTALRGVLIAAAALVAFFYPAQAVQLLVLVGGGLLLVDGVLGLVTLDRSPPRTTGQTLGLVRNLLSIAAGVIVIASGLLTSIFTLSALTWIVGLLALLVGLIEMASSFLDSERQTRLWPTLVGGAVYAAFGLALMFVPLSSAATLLRIAMILMIAYALVLFYRAWSIRAAR